MGETTEIGWTDSTINVWHGCAKVDELCRNCYAEVSTPVRVKRAGGLELWGVNGARSETKSWESELRRWAHEVVTSASGKPRLVFGQSLSDTFEDRRDLDQLRARFFRAVTGWEQRSLIFQLLTKRPQNVPQMVPAWWLERWPAHVWIGASVGDRKGLSRIDDLRKVPAPTRFLSLEPLLEDLGELNLSGIHWVIVGGESGNGARPFDLAWARSIRDQCKAAGVPYFFKQAGCAPFDSAGEYIEFATFQKWVDHAKSWLVGRLGVKVEGGPWTLVDTKGRICTNGAEMMRARDEDAFPVRAYPRLLMRGKGGELAEIPQDLRVREMPRTL
jgi:protein gp37